MLPGDRLFCLLAQDYSDMDKFSDWPLHITLVPWFRCKTTNQKLISTLTKQLSNYGTLNLTVGKEAYFGKAKNKLVNLIKPEPKLNELEQKLRLFLHNQPDIWLVDETTKRPRQFKPHVSVQPSERLIEKDRFASDKLYIVEQKRSFKQITGVVSLR